MLEKYITPRFCETDALGHINNNSYGVWFEEAREDIYRLFLPSDLSVKKWSLIMASSSYEFLDEVLWGQKILVKTFVEKIGNSSFELSHELYQNDKLCTKGKCVLVHYDFKNKKSVPLPQNIKEELSKNYKS